MTCSFGVCQCHGMAQPGGNFSTAIDDVLAGSPVSIPFVLRQPLPRNVAARVRIVAAGGGAWVWLLIDVTATNAKTAPHVLTRMLNLSPEIRFDERGGKVGR